ncbi:MAG: EF-P lysine aminoacylase EpmA [Planctomycetota bacterium]|jgi:elongation factor P--(R)-beta-lysine ligase|nr:EF-P lysine aminoacylase EpmA [Planctomycetia bacterium]
MTGKHSDSLKSSSFPLDHGPSATIETLRLRASMTKRIRTFFDSLDFLEVDTPVLSREVLPETTIDPLAVPLPSLNESRYLQASPEALMKRLLAAGSGPIYQFAHAFRLGERGMLHDIEFTMLEWYAPGWTLDRAAEVLDTLCQMTIGSSGVERISCRNAFLTHAGIDPFLASVEDFCRVAAHLQIQIPKSLEQSIGNWFEIFLSEVVGPRLGHVRPVILEAWPVCHAAFAALSSDSPPTAQRFELFIQGIEVANGWQELVDPEHLLERIHEANQARVQDRRDSLPIPHRLIEAHRFGMPQALGVAIGFDRLVMLATHNASIDDTRSFSSERA